MSYPRAELEAVQNEYERETGERPSLEVANVILDRQREADSYRDEFTLEEAKEDAKALAVTRPREGASCDECGKLGDYYDGVCYECASQSFGLWWQLEERDRY
jgi:hypothetical protein